MALTPRCNRCIHKMRNDGTEQEPKWVCNNKKCVKYVKPAPKEEPKPVIEEIPVVEEVPVITPEEPVVEKAPVTEPEAAATEEAHPAEEEVKEEVSQKEPQE